MRVLSYGVAITDYVCLMERVSAGLTPSFFRSFLSVALSYVVDASHAFPQCENSGEMRQPQAWRVLRKRNFRSGGRHFDHCGRSIEHESSRVNGAIRCAMR